MRQGLAYHFNGGLRMLVVVDLCEEDSMMNFESPQKYFTLTRKRKHGLCLIRFLIKVYLKLFVIFDLTYPPLTID